MRVSNSCCGNPSENPARGTRALQRKVPTACCANRGRSVWRHRGGLLTGSKAVWVASLLLFAGAVGQAAEQNLVVNGTFEFWDHFGSHGLECLKPHLWTNNPAVPQRWSIQVSQPSTLTRSAEGHGGQSSAAFTVPKYATARLEMYRIEGLPNAAYHVGFWIKGSGKAALAVQGLALEGRQTLATVEGVATGVWTQVRGTLTLPAHTRTVALQLSVFSQSELLIDDVFFSAELDEPHDADAILGTKYGKDEHTLFFEDFDGPTVSSISSCKEVAVTDERGGRFGKGLRLDRKGSASIPFALGPMPEEGTLECWVAPDNNEGMPYLTLMGDRGVLGIGNWKLRIAAGTDYPGVREPFALEGLQEVDVYRMGTGVWHHVAYTWDRSTVRLTIDGVLCDLRTSEAITWPGKVAFIQLSGQLPHSKKTDGTIDEIRISNIRRYGPVVPRGAHETAPVAIKSAAKTPVAPSLPAKAPPSAESVTAARKAMIGGIAPSGGDAFQEQPNPDGDYVYEAAFAKPLIRGERCDVESDKIVKGLTVVRVDRATGFLVPDYRSNAGLYWTLKGIPRAPYWIGVIYGGDGRVGNHAPLTVYLNGRIVQMATQSDPVQIAPDQWFVEAFAGQAEELSPGDEVAVAAGQGEGTLVRLLLHRAAPAAPALSPWRYPTNFGGHQWNLYTALGVNAEGRFMLKDGKPAPNVHVDAMNQTAESLAALQEETGKVSFVATLANPLPIPVTVAYRCVVKSFYAETVAEDVARLTLQPHDRVERTLTFDWKEGELTHVADIALLESDPPDLSKSHADGGLGWPRHEKLSFFTGHRQILKWPDPFNTRVVRRITIATPHGGTRQAYRLDGNDWESGFTTALEPPMPVPADTKFDRARVPKGWHHPPLDSFNPRPHGVYYRRSVTLPGEIAGRSFQLVVDYVNCEATAYVNGVKCGNVRGEDTPLVCDISKAVRPGTNELVIVVRDALAIMNKNYVNRDAPAVNLSYLDAPGIFGANGYGIGPVAIHSAPAVSSEDVFVATSVRQKRITARIVAANRGREPVAVTMSAEVLDGGRSVLQLGTRDLTLNPDEPVAFSLEQPWPEPVLWEPGSPHLYALRVTIADSRTGTILDVSRERFGFRESWIDGPHIMLNGRPIRPVGYGTMFRFHPRGNFTFTRGGGRDWMDEVGILGYKGISGLRNTPSQFNIENDTFWQTAEANNIAALKQQQNNPHILAWDISNEWLCFFWGDAMQGAGRFKALSDAVRAYDPTRWTLANAEGDLHGLLDNYSFHYMNHYFGPPNEYTMNGRTPYWPDSSYWRSLDRQFTPGEETSYCPIHPVMLNPEKKVIMDNEFLWKSGGLYMPPGPTRVVGEDDVLSPAVDSSSGPIAWMWKTELDGHRDFGLSVVNPYSFHPGVIRGAFLEQALIMPENQHHGFAGSKQTRRFTLINSLFDPHAMTLTWKLMAPDGKVAEGGKFPFQMNSGDIRRGELAFTLPRVPTNETYTLNATLDSDGEFVCGEEWDIAVSPALVPERAAGTAARDLLLYDPKGVTARALAALGVTFQTLPDLGGVIANPARTTVVIGEDAINPFIAGTTAPLASFVEQGGRVVVLAQEAAPANLPVDTQLDARKWSSQVFVRAGTHPIVAGLSSYDLHFWQPDRSVGTGAYKKPFSGSFVTMVDTSFWGYWDDMNWAQMLEAFRGKGSYVLCQLPLASRHDVEPMAAELLSRIIRYACGAAGYASPTRSLQAISAPGSEVAGILERLNIVHRLAGTDADCGAESPTLLDADLARAASPERQARWAEQLRQGAKVVVVNAEPRDAEWLSRLAAARVTVAVPPHAAWDGRGFRRGWSHYTAGLSQLDLYWKRYAQDEKAGSQADDPSNVIEPLQHYAVSVEQGRELIFPGMLVEVPVGSGVMLLDQRRWAAKDAALARLAMRNVSALMTALDVGMAAFVEPRALPKDLVHRPIDLAALATWPLQPPADAASRGPIDLSGFPQGSSRLLGIPFALTNGPTRGIALAAAGVAGAGHLPGEVVIPVGFLAEGFYFLHTAAGATDGLAATYKIVYEDGTAQDVPVKGRVHVADWNGLELLPGAEIVWTGSTAESPLTGVYRMLWVNHRPEVPVKAILFSNPEREAFPVLLGVTAAARRETVPVSTETAAQARRAFADGQAAFQGGKIDDARRLLREAIVLDASLQEAYQSLADAAERKGDREWMLDAYRLWSISGPRKPLPWNRLGELLEQRDDRAGALEAYKRSLRIEWNQPPVMESVRRLEAK